jgi:hypothetical protein
MCFARLFLTHHHNKFLFYLQKTTALQSSMKQKEQQVVQLREMVVKQDESRVPSSSHSQGSGSQRGPSSSRQQDTTPRRPPMEAYRVQQQPQPMLARNGGQADSIITPIVHPFQQQQQQYRPLSNNSTSTYEPGQIRDLRSSSGYSFSLGNRNGGSSSGVSPVHAFAQGLRPASAYQKQQQQTRPVSAYPATTYNYSSRR